jgi:hypothetical protein
MQQNRILLYCQSLAYAVQPGPTGIFIERDKLYSVCAFQQSEFRFANDPRDGGLREGGLERSNHRQCMAAIADCRQAQYT